MKYERNRPSKGTRYLASEGAEGSLVARSDRGLTFSLSEEQAENHFEIF